jgi:hypothetical protein
MDLRKGIDAFASMISRQPLGLAYHLPEPWAKAGRCFENVKEKVERESGAVRFGWTFHYRVAPGTGEYLFVTHHAVWHAPDLKIIDVTPFHDNPKHRPITQNGSVLFLVDNAAQPVVTNHLIAPRPLRFFPLGDNKRLLDYVDQLKRAEDEKCREIYERRE